MAQSSSNEFHRKKHALWQENRLKLVGFKVSMKSKQLSAHKAVYIVQNIRTILKSRE